VLALAFSPDGKLLASASDDATGLVWDVSELKPARPMAGGLQDAALEGFWGHLSGADGEKAFAAVCALAAGPERSVPFLARRIKPVDRVDEARVEKLIEDLDARRFPVRKKAQDELERLGGLTAPALKKALEASPSVELRKRIEELLAKAKGQTLSPVQLQVVRAIEALERAGTPEARKALQTLARGATGALETVEARAALDRLK
jgi:hypothetical protein